MKLINAEMQTGQVGNFNFSGVHPDKLGSTEYTLVTIVVDKTGSVAGFESELLKMKQTVIEACQKSPRADYLMVRLVEFNNSVDEVHGFAELTNIDVASYISPRCGGMTALYDATYNAVAATNGYAKMLADQDFGVNGLVVVITDGEDNASSYRSSDVAREVSEGVSREWLESLNVILVGINASQYTTQLNSFKASANLTQYVDAGQATASKIAKLAEFVSQSISSQSQALGTGGASQPIVF